MPVVPVETEMVEQLVLEVGGGQERDFGTFVVPIASLVLVVLRRTPGLVDVASHHLYCVRKELRGGNP